MPSFVKRTWHADFAGGGPRSAKQSFVYEALVPDPIADLALVFPDDLVHEMALAEAGVRELQVVAAAGFEPLNRLLMRSESIASSFIEGLAISPRRLAEASLEPGAASETAKEVLGSVRAMELAIDQGAAAGAFATSHLLAIHRSLFEGTRLERIAGRLRETQNWIGGDPYSPRRAEFIPPPEDQVPALLDDLCAFVNRENFPAVAQAAIAHAQFETIHPFADGNGRVGRALIHVLLRRRGIAGSVVPPASIALAGDIARYLSALKAFERGDPLPWCRLFAQTLARATAVGYKAISDISDIQANWARQLRPRGGSALEKLIVALPAVPVLDVKTAAAFLGVSGEAARQAILALEALGALAPSALGRQRYRVWRAPDILAVMDGAALYLEGRR
ncbi:MAG: Fic family protein [Candidatus Sericytochromatia bacterium]|nr:Fic family protein [Candidatus Tanganyikabacteria bacterium]